MKKWEDDQTPQVARQAQHGTMSPHLRVTALCFGSAALLSTAAVAQIPPGYEVVQLTDDPTREWNVDINNHGQIVYESWLRENEFSSEIFLWEDGVTTQLTDDGPLDIRDSMPAINDDGVIVWSRYIGPPGPYGPTAELMVRTPDGVVTQFTDNDVDDIAPAINSLGQIVWPRRMASGCSGGVYDIFFWDGQEVIPITSDAIPEQVANQSARLNDLGQVVWMWGDFCVNPWVSEIKMWDNGVTTRLTTTHLVPNSPDINNRSLVGWSHGFGRDAIDLWEAGRTSQLTDWGTGPRLNESGMVAFIRFDGQNWQDWLYRDGIFWQLSDDPFWNTDSEINDLGEVVWISGPTVRTDIRYLRRFSQGDLNCDGVVGAFDIEPFIMAMVDVEGYRGAYPACDPLLADVNDDSRVDAFDIEPFIDLLIP